MYIIERLDRDSWILKLYTPNGRGTTSFKCEEYMDCVALLVQIGFALRTKELLTIM